MLTFMAVSFLSGARAGASGRFKPYLLAGSAVFGILLARRVQGAPPGLAATAAAIPDVLFWGAPAAVVLVALTALLPRREAT
ncbi:hypothetical protein ACFYY8_34850 [Streptosporangium sp. NPDC001559]|uniref:hypothetical protein n=1 Tax=Streptosporangium sp. NPDC001559 TaxID=3366187 RepID=UPI0036E30661